VPVLQDHHMNVIQLDIPRGLVSVADMFAVLEREKAAYNILYYTVSQTTLDTVGNFLIQLLIVFITNAIRDMPD